MDDLPSTSQSKPKMPRIVTANLRSSFRPFSVYIGGMDSQEYASWNDSPGSYNVTDPFSSSRQEKSLGLLTQKFLELLQQSKSGILDLNTVSKRWEIVSEEFLYLGRRSFKCEAETANLRYYKCFGRRWAYWKKEQKFGAMEVSP